jgi:hypothetical protein
MDETKETAHDILLAHAEAVMSSKDHAMVASACDEWRNLLYGLVKLQDEVNSAKMQTDKVASLAKHLQVSEDQARLTRVALQEAETRLARSEAWIKKANVVIKALSQMVTK